jgi:hypothetical protein
VKYPYLLIAGAVALALAGDSMAVSTAGLKITYGAQGIQRISYNGTTLDDMGLHPGDAFHIGHMKAVGPHGAVLDGGQYDWGENNSGRHWDEAAKTWTYHYNWGSIAVHFVQSGDALNMEVTEVNLANSGVTFHGATIFPFVLRFPRLPTGFANFKYEQLAFNTTGPSVTVADYGRGQVTAVVPDASKPLYSGFEPAGTPNAYFPIISSTAIEHMAAFFPSHDRPVAPGHTDSFTVALRFTPSQTPASTVAMDAFQSWAKAWPPSLHWPDRRLIGTVFLAESPQGGPAKPGGAPNNPRRYVNGAKTGEFNVLTRLGLLKFQAGMLRQAAETAQNLKRLNAQGVITWDIEGEQFQQPTSYVCAPDEIAQVAPEMESIISDRASPFAGMKLDDAYFKIIRDAGFRVGVCVRPQHFSLNRDGTANQVSLPASEAASELVRKMEYAHNRWGATLFYVDSNVEASGEVLDPDIFQQAAAKFPDSLIIPEHSTPKYYAYTAPFATFVFHGDLGSPSDIYHYYPNAFSVNLVNDADPVRLRRHETQLRESVKRGDILMVLAGYWQANNPAVVRIYKRAGGSP